MNNAVECFVIILIIAVVGLVYLRSGRKGIAFSVLPLITVPFFHCASWLVQYNLFSGISMYSKTNFYMIVDVIALGIGLLLCGLCANGFKKKVAVIYLLMATLFNVLFTAILLVNNLQFILDK